MKIEMTEHEGCFGIEISAETMKEAALLARFGAGHTKELRHFSVSATTEGEFLFSLVFGKTKNWCGYISK